MAPLTPGRDGQIGRYLRRNDKVWTPPAVITFDTESWRRDRGDGEDQALRLWTARLDDRRPPHHGEAQQLAGRGYTGAELAALIDGWTRKRESVWLYAHNLGYDLITSQLVEHMCGRGWDVRHCSAVPEYIFLTMARGRHRITLTDLHHLLPARLADIGAMLGVAKLPMPAEGAPDDDWFAYCGRDTDVTAAAVLELMAHWDDYGLGNWSLSGASCGFRAMRHTLPAKAITLIEDQAASTNERAAIYGGRRYCWRHGEQLPGRYAEFDFTAAHATTAATWPMPAKRGPWFDRLDPHHQAVDGKYAVVIAECEVKTDTPRYPCRINGRVWFPVGRFRTVLASPEIAWARDNGDLIAIGRGQFHYTSSVMRPFFRRVLEWGAPGKPALSPVVSLMWKQWGRSVIGKFAQRGYAITDTRMLTDRAWFYERAIDAESGDEYWLLHYGGRIRKAVPDGDGAQAYPAVLALVESYERVALGRAAELLGEASCIQCDTDGIWVDVGRLEAGTDTGLGFDLADTPRELRVDLALACVNNQLAGLQLREKHSVARIAIWGPQNYDAGNKSKHSGRPSRLTEVQPGVWAGDTFPAVAHQMATAPPGVFRTELITWTRPANAVPGWVLDGGAVRPVETLGEPGVSNQLRPWAATRWAAAGEQLGPVQHKALAGYWTPATVNQEVGTSGDDQADTGHDAGRAEKRPCPGQTAVEGAHTAMPPVQIGG